MFVSVCFGFRRPVSQVQLRPHPPQPGGSVSSVENGVVPPSVVDNRMDELRPWICGSIEAPEIFELLEMDQDRKMPKNQQKEGGHVNFWQMRGKSGLCARNTTFKPFTGVGVLTYRVQEKTREP